MMHRILKFKSINLTLGGLITIIMSAIIVPAHAVTVDVLFLYDDYTNDYYNGSVATAAQSLVDQANGMYKASDVDIQLRAVGVLNYNISSTSMDVVLESYMTDWVKQQRTDYGADFVSYMHESGKCGVGWQAVHKDWAYNVIGPGCGGAVAFIHELGHNMGLAHSRIQGDTSGARYAYGLGHVVQNVFGTIMTYYFDYNAQGVSVFSSPRLTCYDLPCGVEEGEASQADAAKALNNVRTEIAGFYPTVIDGMDTDFTSCAVEGDTCSILDTQLVRYGANSYYKYKLLTNDSIQCSNSAFGGDPIRGTVKSCDSIAASQFSYTDCAGENETCSFLGTRVVRYGANGSYNYQLVNEEVSCTNAVFDDPIWGTRKSCSYSSAL